MNTVYYLPINPKFDITQFYHFLSFLPKERQIKVMRYHFDIDKKLSLYAYILLSLIIHQKLRLDLSSITLSYNQYGKPFLKEYPLFHFNISHTNSAIAIAISNKPVGVDIERLRKIDAKIAERFFTAEETNFVNKSSDTCIPHFLKIWTQKEAYIKYLGQGLAVPLNSFNVLDTNMSIQIQSIYLKEYIISIYSEYSYPYFDFIYLSEEDLEQLVHQLWERETP